VSVREYCTGTWVRYVDFPSNTEYRYRKSNKTQNIGNELRRYKLTSTLFAYWLTLLQTRGLHRFDHLPPCSLLTLCNKVRISMSLHGVESKAAYLFTGDYKSQEEDGEQI
jgi:hypothetical protein